jgi:hypothetical protein
MKKRIEIVSTPSGEAPEWVREAWVGLQFRAEKSDPREDRIKKQYGKMNNAGGWKIKKTKAIRALSKKNKEAAQWFKNKDNVPLWRMSFFIFGTQFCEVIKRKSKKS